MHELISTKTKITILVAVILFLFVLFSVAHKVINDSSTLFGPDAITDVFSWIVTTLFALSVVLGFERPWSFIARPKLLRFFGIPPMLGEWRGTIESNYSRHAALRDAARDASTPRWDADSPALVDNIPLLSREATLNVAASFWQIKVTLVTGLATDGHQGIESRSVASRAIRTAEGGIEVWYAYRAVNHDEPLGNDSSKDHQGAARLTFTMVGCEGEYWTARNWRKAMNTAGRMIFTQAN